MSQITKKAMEQSLKKLLLKKPLNKITVSDITNDCGINRMTFYYHFKDIRDLVEWICLEDAQALIREDRTYSNWQEGFLHIFVAVKENKTLIMNVYHSIDREQVETYLKPLVDKLLIEVVEEQSEGMVVREEDKKFIAQIYAYVFVGLLLDWIKDGMNDEPQKIIDQLYRVMHGTFRDALEKVRVDHKSDNH